MTINSDTKKSAVLRYCTEGLPKKSGMSQNSHILRSTVAGTAETYSVARRGLQKINM